MKIICLFIVCFFIFHTNNSIAQKKRIYLFDNFVDGAVWMKNGSKAKATLNYDAANKAMMFMEKEQEMVLSNPQMTDTVFIDSRKFIPAGRIFLEVVPLNHGMIYINWNLKTIYEGKTGAYGTVSQGNQATTINTSWFNNQSYEKQTTDVYNKMVQNEYWLFRNGKPVKFKNKKSLLKLFFQKESEINAFIKENKIDMNIPAHVFLLVDYCLGFDPYQSTK